MLPACSAADEGATGGGGTGTGAGASGDGGLGIGAGAGGSGQGGGCAGVRRPASRVPLDMYVMLDQSGSMDEAAGTTTKWTAVKQALISFVQTPTSGISLGLQYFGLPSGKPQCPVECSSDADCGPCGPCLLFGPTGLCFGAGQDDSCEAADYAKPEIEIAELPGVAGAITQSLDAHGPLTMTPTAPALQGAVDHAKEWQIAHPDHVVVAVLATDGDPSECDTNPDHINGIAATAAGGSPKILTFVIGVGPLLNALDAIAAAGGTERAYMVDADANAQQQFLAALNSIQSELACQYTIPVPDSGTPDFETVNVQYTPEGGVAQTIPKVGGAADCPGSGDAWYYDNDAAPTQILLCDATCTRIAETNGEISIVLGCETVVN